MSLSISSCERYINGCVCLILILIGCYSVGAWSADGMSLEEFSKNIQKSFGTFARIMAIAAYVAGVGFAMIGLLKFKAHKDNPAQIPLSTPVALIAVSAGLLFLPTVFQIAGSAVFGDKAKSAIDQGHVWSD